MLDKFGISVENSSGFLLNYDEVVESTLIGQLNQILSQMKNVETEEEFISAMIRGVTSNYLNNDDKGSLISKIFEKMGQRNPFPNPK